MKLRARVLFVATMLICLIPAAAFAGIAAFTQDFETLNAADPDALGNDGWLIYGTVFEAGTGDYIYGYGAFPAPNNPSAPAFSNIVIGEGGVEQGAQQVSIFSDYENAGAHGVGNLVESNVFKEFLIDATDVGKSCTFAFSAKMGALVPPSTAMAFIKTIDPSDNWAMTNLVSEDMTAIGTEWGGWSLNLVIDEGLVGQYFQVGFANTATNYDGSGIYYDNVVLSTEGGTAPTGMVPYSQDFESLNAASGTALGDDGWLVYGNVFAAGTGDFVYGYGPNPAPNNPSAPAFCTIAVGEGGTEQGAQQISVFSDYENATAHAAGDLVESTTYQEQTIGTGDVGKTWYFQFQAKMPSMGGVAAPSTATAFIKTLDPDAGYTVTNYVTQDMAGISGDWNGWTLSLTIDAGLVGQAFQIGFVNTATLYASSAIIYDNVNLTETVSAVPDGAAMLGATLRQNYPNPFNPKTRIEFSLENPGTVDLAVYDMSGRLVSRLLNGAMAAGDHFATWNGRTRSGATAPAGQYHYVLKTAAGQVSRSMILLK